MTTSDDVLNQARRWLGYAERPVNRTEFGRWYGLDGAPWCAMALSRWFYDAGMPLPATTARGFAYTPAGAAWFQRLGLWQPASRRPGGGMVVFYSFGRQRIDHVGVVESVTADGTVVAIEGNTNGRGSRTGGSVLRQFRRYRIVGFGTPLYATPGRPAPKARRPAPAPDRGLRPILRKGAHGASVRELQAMLNEATGARLAIDGRFGAATFDAVVALQRFWRLRPGDGVVGPKTWGALLYTLALARTRR